MEVKMNLPMSITPQVDVADPSTNIINDLNDKRVLKRPQDTPTEKSSTLSVKAKKNSAKNVTTDLTIITNTPPYYPYIFHFTSFVCIYYGDNSEV